MGAIAHAKKSAHNVLKTMENNWTVQQLCDQWKIQQETQLSTKAYNAQVASKNLAMLIETQKLAEALTANLGLLHVAVPPEMTESDKDFAKQLILLHAVKTSLWNRLQCLQDKLNPICESATRSGTGHTLGTKKLQNAIKAVQNHGKGITGMVDTYNNMVDTLMTMEHPVWASEIQLPAHLDWQQVISIDPDGLLWEEMSFGSTWVTLWGTTYEAAPAYVRDPQVHNGIKMVLQLDRIAEEEE
ncbi:hypothetical protein K439DRAFT_1567804 [Ramaria rubella]|nr:hypothetical protein K439DRAFT_1567804 [Ramaria rubella]